MKTQPVLNFRFIEMVGMIGAIGMIGASGAMETIGAIMEKEGSKGTYVRFEFSNGGIRRRVPLHPLSQKIDVVVCFTIEDYRSVLLVINGREGEDFIAELLNRFRGGPYYL